MLDVPKEMMPPRAPERVFEVEGKGKRKILDNGVEREWDGEGYSLLIQFVRLILSFLSCPLPSAVLLSLCCTVPPPFPTVVHALQRMMSVYSHFSALEI